MKRQITFLLASALLIGSAHSATYFKENGSGAFMGASTSGRYVVMSDQMSCYFVGGLQDISGQSSTLWDTQTGSVLLTTEGSSDALEEGGCFMGVNNSGTVVGYYKSPDYQITAMVVGETCVVPLNCAAYWQDGETYPLGLGEIDTSACKKHSDGSQAIAISDDGKTIAGTVTVASKTRACIWRLQEDGSWKYEELRVPEEEGVDIANIKVTDISSDGLVITGYIELTGNGSAAVYWVDGIMYTIPIQYDDLEDPSKKGIENKAVSVSANGMYIGLTLDKTIPAVYSREAGAYVRMEYSPEVKVQLIYNVGVSDNGNGVASLKIAGSSKGKEANYYYIKDLARTVSFDYYSKVNVPDIDIKNGYVADISADGKIISGHFGNQPGSWSMGMPDEDIEMPVSPNPVKSRLTGLRTVEITWDAINNNTETWNVKAYRLYEDGYELAEIPYAPYAREYMYVSENSKCGYLTYHMTIVYENGDGVTIESPRSEYTSQTVSDDTSFPLHNAENDFWSRDLWTQTFQIAENPVYPSSWGVWSRLYGFEGGAVGKCSVTSEEPYSLAIESRLMDATDVDDNIHVSFPRRYIRAEGSGKDFSHEYLSVEVSTDYGQTWTEAKTWRGDEINWKWDFDYADITDLAKGKLFQVRLRRHGEGKAQFVTLIDYLNINTEVGKPVEGLTSFDKGDGNVELIWKNNCGAYDLNYMGNRYGNAYVYGAANAGKDFIAATLYKNDKLAPFDGKYISGITTTINWFGATEEDASNMDAKILIWQDDQLIREQTVIDKPINENYVIRLDEPVLIDAGKSLKIGIRINNYPAEETPLLYVNSMTYVNGQSDLYSEDGGKTWSTLEEAWKNTEKPEDGIGSWMISCNVTDQPGLPEGANVDNTLTGFNVYRNGEKINDELVWFMEGRFITPKVEGDSQYTLLPIYKAEGIGPMSAPYDFNGTGVEGVFNDGSDVGFRIQGDNIILNEPFTSAAIHSLDGCLMAQPTESVFSVETLPAGVYVVTVRTDYGIKSFKFIR